jgi:hypothetical protein
MAGAALRAVVAPMLPGRMATLLFLLAGWRRRETAGSDEFSVGQSHTVVVLGEVQAAIVNFITSRLCVAMDS